MKKLVIGWTIQIDPPMGHETRTRWEIFMVDEFANRLPRFPFYETAQKAMDAVHEWIGEHPEKYLFWIDVEPVN